MIIIRNFQQLLNNIIVIASHTSLGWSSWCLDAMEEHLKCGICLELFQDPRSLPCLHTFCRECIQRSLNEENHSLKCPVCRAKHELSEGAGPLPVNQYALQKLPLKRLQQQREDNGGPHQLVECKSCGEQAVMVAWCYDCVAIICQSCVASHKKLAIFREHRVAKIPAEGETEVVPRASSAIMAIPKCLTHIDQNLKHFCVPCSELVCSDCLLTGSHAGHEHSLVDEARRSLETGVKELGSLVKEKNEEFSNYLEKANKAEGKALEYSEHMKCEVNNVFDGIVASVEAQRNEALQSVSQGVKEIWSQKEMMEVSLAQLDSFTRFVDHTHKCTTDASFVSMATQCIKLMSQIKNVKGDETALNRNMVAILPLCRNEEDSPLHVVLKELFILGRPSLFFVSSPGESRIVNGRKVSMVVALTVGGELISSKYLREKCSLNVLMYWSTKPVKDEPSNDDDEESENDDKESENDDEESENDDEESEDDDKESEDDDKESENDDKESDDDEESEDDDKESEDDDKESEDDDKESENDHKDSENDEDIEATKSIKLKSINLQAFESSEDDDEVHVLTTKNDYNSESINEDESKVIVQASLNILPSSSEGGIESFTEEDAVEIECSTKLVDDMDGLGWVIDANFRCLLKDYQSLVIRCKLSGAISSETVQVRLELLNSAEEDDMSSNSSDDSIY